MKTWFYEINAYSSVKKALELIDLNTFSLQIPFMSPYYISRLLVSIFFVSSAYRALHLRATFIQNALKRTPHTLATGYTQKRVGRLWL